VPKDEATKGKWPAPPLCLRQRNCIGMVAEHDHRIIGFMIYELHKSRLRGLNFATTPDMRRQGVGSQMIRPLVDKQRRSEIMIEVRETNLEAQFFFRNRVSARSAACAATTATRTKTPT
jgi:ribosomal protein S18 acetylase RimI-like enzyme